MKLCQYTIWLTICTLARTLLPRRIRQVLHQLPGLRGTPASTECRVIDNDIAPTLVHGWQAPLLAQQQQQAFAPLLQQMYQGHPREDFVALARAVEATGMNKPLIIEAGCGSGWNAEVLAHLLKRPIHYIGMDYSSAMVKLGQQKYPNYTFITGDATKLPFADSACDILVSGTVLMHLLGYREAIAESRRVAHSWCIFHTVPIVQNHPTTILHKRAYGESVVEVVYNERELLDIFENNNLFVKQVYESIPHNYLNDLLKESVLAYTYFCKII